MPICWQASGLKDFCDLQCAQMLLYNIGVHFVLSIPCPCRVSPPGRGAFFMPCKGEGDAQTNAATHTVSGCQAFPCRGWLSSVSAAHADIYKFKISTPSKKFRFHFSAFCYAQLNLKSNRPIRIFSSCRPGESGERRLAKYIYGIKVEGEGGIPCIPSRGYVLEFSFFCSALQKRRKK